MFCNSSTLGRGVVLAIVLAVATLMPPVSSQYQEVVHTVADIEDPVGLAYGVFNGDSGLFVSSFSLHDVFFFTHEQLSKYSPVHHPALTRIVSGGQNDVNIDGSFDTASFADPSRMDYDEERNVLYVASRLTMTIREVDFNSKVVSTISDNSGTELMFSLSDSHFSDFPGLDIQLSNSELMFVANSKEVFKITRDGSVYQKIKFDSVDEYLKYKDYPYSACNIYSVAPDNRNKILYITVSEAKNVILRVPFGRTNELEAPYVLLVTGVEQHTWDGLGTAFPSIISGTSEATVLGMPMHLQYDAVDNLLIWSEGVPAMDGVMVGSLMIRQLDLSTADQMTSDVAGVNAFDHSPIDYNTYMGSYGGYEDGIASLAAFKYPISIEYAKSTIGNSVSSPVIYVADRWNNAIRRVDREVYTASPSITFSPTRSPTISLRPTRGPTRSPSRPPVTYVPTMWPSRSMSPTTRFRPTPLPTEPDPPAVVPTSRPSHIHVIGRPTKQPTHNPTEPVAVEIRYEDHSAFGNMGFGQGGVGSIDIFLATLLGLLLAALIVLFLVMKDRAAKRQARRAKKKLVMRLDDDDSDDSDDDDRWDNSRPAGDIRPRPSGVLGSLYGAWDLAAGYWSAAVGDAGSSGLSVSFSDSSSDAGSAHSDAELIDRSSHSSSSAKSKFGISRFFSKKGTGLGLADNSHSSDGLSIPKTGTSSSISSMLQKLKISTKQQNADDRSFTTSLDAAAPVGDFSNNGLMSDYSSRGNVEGGGVQMQDRSRAVGARSATGIAEGSVTRGGGSRRSGPDYL